MERTYLQLYYDLIHIAYTLKSEIIVNFILMLIMGLNEYHNNRNSNF